SVYFVSGHSLVFSHGTAMSVIYTLSLHDALPIFRQFTVNDGIERSDLLVDLRAVEVDQFVNLFRRPGIGTADHRDDRSQPLVQARAHDQTVGQLLFARQDELVLDGRQLVQHFLGGAGNSRIAAGAPLPRLDLRAQAA